VTFLRRGVVLLPLPIQQLSNFRVCIVTRIARVDEMHVAIGFVYDAVGSDEHRLPVSIASCCYEASRQLILDKKLIRR